MLEKQVKQVFNGVTSYITENDEEHLRHVELVKTWHEIHMLEHISRTKRTGNIIDIGANVGQHTVFFATHCTTGNVYAYEPNQHSFKCLIRNIVDNKLTNVYPIFAAVGDFGFSKVKTAERSGISGVAKDGDGNTIIVLPLLDYGQTDLIKIDVEGMEVEVLKNCMPIIKKYKPEIYIETFENLELITAMLWPLGYKMKGRFNNAPTYWFAL